MLRPSDLSDIYLAVTYPSPPNPPKWTSPPPPPTHPPAGGGRGLSPAPHVHINDSLTFPMQSHPSDIRNASCSASVVVEVWDDVFSINANYQLHPTPRVCLCTHNSINKRLLRLSGHAILEAWPCVGNANPPPPPLVGNPGSQRVGERVGGAFYRLGGRDQNFGAYYAVLAVQLSFHFAWHSSISAKFWFLATRWASRRLGGELYATGASGAALCTDVGL